MSNSSPERNKAIVLEAFETLFNKRDYVAAERFWSPNYIQHSAHIPPGREGLFNLVRSVPETLHYENQLIIAEGDYVIAHGRFTGMGGPPLGLQRTLSGSKTVFSKSIGTFYRTRRPRPNL
jgi:predicted SnoaL-like aldol condensation-catalyzing enzyme